MTAHDILQEVESGLMAEERAPALLTGGTVTSLSNEPTLNNDDHHLEKTTTRSTHAKTDIAGEKSEKDVDAIIDEDSGLLSGARLYLVFLSLMLAVLVSPPSISYYTKLMIRCLRWINLLSRLPSQCWCPISTRSSRYHGSLQGTCTSFTSKSMLIC
jgi:hypothetical protein